MLTLAGNISLDMLGLKDLNTPFRRVGRETQFIDELVIEHVEFDQVPNSSNFSLSSKCNTNAFPCPVYRRRFIQKSDVEKVEDRLTTM